MAVHSPHWTLGELMKKRLSSKIRWTSTSTSYEHYITVQCHLMAKNREEIAATDTKYHPHHNHYHSRSLAKMMEGSLIITTN
jgi:predicted HAD superfamily phosphohydrolase